MDCDIFFRTLNYLNGNAAGTVTDGSLERSFTRKAPTPRKRKPLTPYKVQNDQRYKAFDLVLKSCSGSGKGTVFLSAEKFFFATFF